MVTLQLPSPGVLFLLTDRRGWKFWQCHKLRVERTKKKTDILCLCQSQLLLQETLGQRSFFFFLLSQMGDTMVPWTSRYAPHPSGENLPENLSKVLFVLDGGLLRNSYCKQKQKSHHNTQFYCFINKNLQSLVNKVMRFTKIIEE